LVEPEPLETGPHDGALPDSVAVRGVFESAAKAAAFRMKLFRITPVDVYLLWSTNNLQAITRRLRANLLG
jgi:hypothetical protein